MIGKAAAGKTSAASRWRLGNGALPYAAPPGGETLSAMAARCAAWLASLDRRGQPVLAVTHAGPIRVIRALLGGEPLMAYFSVSVAPSPSRLPSKFFLAKLSSSATRRASIAWAGPAGRWWRLKMYHAMIHI